jgi:hypothetical protein
MLVFTGLVPVIQFTDERPLGRKLDGRDKPGQDGRKKRTSSDGPSRRDVSLRDGFG